MRQLMGLAAILLLIGAWSAPGYANSNCGYCPKGWYGGKDSKGSYHSGGLDDKFFSKAHKMLVHKEELGLSEDQIQTIRNLKLSAKKELIQRNADVGVVAVDIHAKLRENPVDVEAVNALIDRKYNAKKAKSQSLVKSYAELKDVLTDEQMAKLKELWKK